MTDTHEWKIEEYFKEGYFYRRKSEQWEFDDWGFYPNGIGDLIYNTLRVIIETEDKSRWAEWAFIECSMLLSRGKRWPDSMNDEPTEIYRSQFSMTRDPWILYYACAIHLGRTWPHLYEKIPFHLYSPKTWAWRRALLGKWNLYWFWKWLLPPKKQFVKDLHYFREYSLSQLKNK